MRSDSSGWRRTRRPLAPEVHGSFQGHASSLSLGKGTTPPGTQGSSCDAGHRIIGRSPSKGPVCLEPGVLLRTGPSPARALQIIAALPHHMAASLGSVPVQFLHRGRWLGEIFADGFPDMRRGDADRTDETGGKTRAGRGAAAHPPRGSVGLLPPLRSRLLFPRVTPQGTSRRLIPLPTRDCCPGQHGRLGAQTPGSGSHSQRGVRSAVGPAAPHSAAAERPPVFRGSIGASSGSRPSKTRGPRRSLTVAAITSSSEAPGSASQRRASATSAGAPGGCPRSVGRSIVAHACCCASSHRSCRCSRTHRGSRAESCLFLCASRS